MLPDREPVATDRAPSPLEVIARWPADRPLSALVTAEPAGADTDAAVAPGWSLLAEPAAWRIVPRGGLGSGAAAVAALRERLRAPAREDEEPADHGRGGWIACLAYELGRSLEPAVDAPAPPPAGHDDGAAAGSRRSIDDRRWPDLALARVEAGLLHERATGRWWRFGDAARRAAAEAALAAAVAGGPETCGPARAGPRVRRSPAPAAHEAAVARAREAIAAGEIFQANVTARRTVAFDGSLRRLALTAFVAARPRYGALLEVPGGRGVVSVSPELFLELDAADAPDRAVRSRPIKGTRPVAAAGGDAATGADPDGVRRLLESPKDEAELAMIVDLMRNDLGRVALRGGVRVSRPRHVETHPTVHHALAEVRAAVPPGLDVATLLAATFPPGSVTGAPKIRAMQVIERLEPVRRGPYCGSIGWIGDDGAARLNVAIRTLVVSPAADPASAPDGAADHAPRAVDVRTGLLDYGAGGGIVADSDPAAERREADLKAEVFLRTLRALAADDETRKTREAGAPPGVEPVAATASAEGRGPAR